MTRFTITTIRGLLESSKEWEKRILRVASRHQGPYGVGRYYQMIVRELRRGNTDRAVSLLVGSFGFNPLPPDVQQLLDDWEASSDYQSQP